MSEAAESTTSADLSVEISPDEQPPSSTPTVATAPSEPTLGAAPAPIETVTTGGPPTDHTPSDQASSDHGQTGDKAQRIMTRVPRATGVTGRGVIVLIVVATVIGGLVDLAASGHRGSAFAVLFVIASACGAAAVRRRDLTTAMVAPPLLYCVMIAVMSLVDQGGLTGGWKAREAFYLANAFVTGAPAIWIGTAVAVAIGWYRKRAPRRR